MKRRSRVCSRYSSLTAGMERLSLDLMQAFKNVAERGSV